MSLLKTYRNRSHLLEILSEQKIKRACEIGVKEGEYSKEILSKIPSLEKLYLVDCWEHQPNYLDGANVSNRKHIKFFNRAMGRVRFMKHKVEVLKGYSKEMSVNIPDASLDWAYIDARHDFCGTKEDLESYWPKIKDGGLISGHDYLEAPEVRGQDWSMCLDGSINPGAVKGAVDEFALKNHLQVLVSYKDLPWPTWTIIKPKKCT